MEPSYAAGATDVPLLEETIGANFERTVDGFLAGLPYAQLLKALQQINLNPLERPIVDIGI